MSLKSWLNDSIDWSQMNLFRNFILFYGKTALNSRFDRIKLFYSYFISRVSTSQNGS